MSPLATLRGAKDWPAYYGLYLSLLKEIVFEGTICDEANPWWDPQEEGT